MEFYKISNKLQKGKKKKIEGTNWKHICAHSATFTLGQSRPLLLNSSPPLKSGSDPLHLILSVMPALSCFFKLSLLLPSRIKTCSSSPAYSPEYRPFILKEDICLPAFISSPLYPSSQSNLASDLLNCFSQRCQCLPCGSSNARSSVLILLGPTQHFIWLTSPFLKLSLQSPGSPGSPPTH